MATASSSRVYVVSGGGGGSGSTTTASGTSLPDLLKRHGSSNKRKKRKAALSRDEQLSRIELIQDFEFPEASNVIRSTRDGQHIVATGMYKPQMRVWECEQLSLKFERHTDAENIDFILLSDDWTKSLHLQTDRTLELHAQGGHHTRLRIPKFGRALGYHFPTATALVGARGREVYRLNLDQGRFMEPFVLGEGSSSGVVTGCNAVDVNPAHGLISLGTEGTGVVELWDPRLRSRAGSLGITVPSVLNASLQSAKRRLPGVLTGQEDEAALGAALEGLSVSALSSAEDGLNLAVGTSTGHVLLYDLRMSKPYAEKDQGFGLPIKSLSWPGDRGAATSRSARTEAHDAVLSADSKVIKVWSKEQPEENIVSITPGPSLGDLNCVHHIPGSGLIVSTVEGTRCGAWYVPALGPAPAWCSFLDTLTDEIDDEQTGSKKGVYEDFKFIDKAELELLQMTHLIGTDLLRPYMHGYFVSLRLYEKARLLANPTAYADARERAIQARIDKAAESRIRASPKDLQRIRRAEKELEGVRVNRELAERVRRETDREEKKRERRAERAKELGKDPEAEEALAAQKEAERGDGKKSKSSEAANLLADDRFKDLFTNPEFQIDDTTREFAMLNPSTAVRGTGKKTAVEELDDASDRESVDPDQESDADSSGDSSDEGDLGQFDPRQHQGQRRKDLEKAAGIPQRDYRKTGAGARLVDDDDDGDARPAVSAGRGASGKARTFQERLRANASAGRGRDAADGDEAGARELTWNPSRASAEKREARPDAAKKRRKGEEQFGAGLSRGAGREEGVGTEGLGEEQRSGRVRRRDPNRSASKNTMRR